VLEALLEQPPDVIVLEAVIDELSRAAAPNDVQLPQSTKLMRDGRLRHAHDAGEVRRAELAEGKRVQDPNAGRIAEHLERLRQELGLRDGENLAFEVRAGMRGYGRHS
jgi:hypothetical protein